MTRGQAKKVEAATKENAHPAAKPTAGKKNAKSTATASKPAKKRKSPSPELSDDTTLVDEPAEGPSPKKKKASPKASTKKEKPEVSGKAAKGGEKTEKKDTTAPQPTPAASTSPIDHEAIATHVKQAVHSAIMPFTKLLDPFMQFQMQCAKLGEETGVEANAKRTQVIDIIAELQARHRHRRSISASSFRKLVPAQRKQQAASMADSSAQFKEPTRTHVHAPATEAAHSHGSAAERAAPGLERQGSVSKMARVAKRLVTSPREEKEQVQLDRTLEREVKKGPKEADVGLMEV
ncbi:hypothetical protein EJ07DRAFT_174967 [Lizonia empirigonia]|nr:hypothetical protein EJ07DRAFT_174967 [Lizonia empirigonia]